MRLTSILLAALTGLLLAAPLQAQSKFSPVIKVNERVITQFELDQRITFLTVLKFPGDIRAEAEKGLIEDRLRMDQAKALGIKIAPEMIDSGMSEFAARANLTSEQFLQAIGEAGIAPETFYDFVEAGVAWREVVRARFAGQISVSAADIARAKDAENGRGKGFQVLLSEIFLPAQPGSVGKNIRLATEIAEGEHGSFAEAAAKYSAAASRLQGGAVDWLPVSSLPPQVANALGKLGQGQISEPVQLPGYIGVFQLRGMRDGGDVKPSAMLIDYAEFRLPAAGAEAEVAAITARARGCDDLYALANGRPEGTLTRTRMRRGQIPADLGATIDTLDHNETTLVKANGGARLLMLCERNAMVSDSILSVEMPPVDPLTGTTATLDGTPAIADKLGLGYGASDAQLSEEIANQKLGHLAEAYLAELKAAAHIRYP